MGWALGLIDLVHSNVFRYAVFASPLEALVGYTHRVIGCSSLRSCIQTRQCPEKEERLFSCSYMRMWKFGLETLWQTCLLGGYRTVSETLTRKEVGLCVDQLGIIVELATLSLSTCLMGMVCKWVLNKIAFCYKGRGGRLEAE